MSLIDIFILSVALGIDCLVVSFSQGLIFTKNRVRNSLMLGLTMGFCQGFMPFLSFIGTEFVSKFIESYAQIIVFLIFLALGAKFIAGAFLEKKEEICCIDFKCLIGMGIATSIDALASGVGLNLANAPLFVSISLIGIISFVMSLCGFWFGNFFKKLPSKVLEISGGTILILLALKVLIEGNL